MSSTRRIGSSESPPLLIIPQVRTILERSLLRMRVFHLKESALWGPSLREKLDEERILLKESKRFPLFSHPKMARTDTVSSQ
ncbi:hypothetical protein TNCV_2905261 [Trichonephila clavipes]|nr:hypothetical protein TNCV_2905261 [Trichonephila clavipes]